MPHDSSAMPLISSAFSRPSLPRLARESVLPRASAWTPSALLRGRALPQERLGALPEGVGKDGIVLGKYLVQRHYHLALEVGDALLEALVKPCELAQLYHRLVSELAGAKLAKAQGVGYEDAVDEVGFDPRAPLEAAHRIGSYGIDDDDVVALGVQEAEQRQPVVAGGFHADEHLLRRCAQPFEVGCALAESFSGVCELHGLGGVLAALVHRTDDVARFGYVYSSADHGPASFAHGRPLHSKRARNLLKETRGGQTKAPPSS